MDDHHELTAGYALDALDPQERERYEAHLAFLTFSTQTDTASVLTPRMSSNGPHAAAPKGAVDKQDLEVKKE